MSEYWKSTPKYWCKHCSVYVRDTKLERQNHESTGKHQGAIKRFLRDIHRGHENQEKEKERAKREIDRLNGVVGTSSGASSSSATTSAPQASAQATTAQRQKQWEQLADMGIDVPTELRGDMAMAGEWTVTNTKVIDDTPKTDENGNVRVEAVATGVRKRQKREGEDEEEEALQALFKKPKKWGRDTRRAEEEDLDLDALLNGSLKQVEPVKQEKVEIKSDTAIKKEEEEEEKSPIKQESPENDHGIPAPAKAGEDLTDIATVKTEETSAAGVEVPAVVFKKRKPKNLRQK
ncbi:u1 zinc finger [Apiospora arundinis]